MSHQPLAISHVKDFVLPTQDRLNIAVFIDFDNIEIGVKSTLGQTFDVGTILDAIKERGEVVTKIAYADWTRAGEYSRSLTQHAIRLVQRNLTPGGDKNGADINLALDALEMAFTHPHINAYVIVGGDSDFLSLVEKLKQYDKKVFVVGGRQFTSMILQRNCHEFIAYENLAGVRRASSGGKGPSVPAGGSAPIAQAIPIVRRALKILADREVSPQTGLLKSTLLQLDSTFSERNYGASSFLDFVEKLAHAGLVTLKHAGRSVMVELNPAAGDGEAAVAPSEGASEVRGEAQGRPEGRPPHVPHTHVGDGLQAVPTGLHSVPTGLQPVPIVQAIESQEAGVERASRILAAATHARWPMYLRNVKQILRASEGGFDERRYGFGGLMDLLKACQRAGVVRIERDRRGGLRVFQGSALQTVPRGLPQPEPPELAEAEAVEAQAGQVAEAAEAIDSDVQPEIEPMPIDTTAELLGRAKPRKPRARAARPAAAALAPAAAPKAKGTRKTAVRRASRKRTAAETSDV